MDKGLKVFGEPLFISDKVLGHRLNFKIKTKVKRLVSGETYYTNECGWRIYSPLQKKVNAKFSFLGCSICMGSGTNFDESIDIAFNVNYLQEILSNVDDDEIEVHFFGSDKSCLLTCPNSETYKYVVMPLLI